MSETTSSPALPPVPLYQRVRAFIMTHYPTNAETAVVAVTATTVPALLGFLSENPHDAATATGCLGLFQKLAAHADNRPILMTAVSEVAAIAALHVANPTAATSATHFFSVLARQAVSVGDKLALAQFMAALPVCSAALERHQDRQLVVQNCAWFFAFLSTLRVAKLALVASGVMYALWDALDRTPDNLQLAGAVAAVMRHVAELPVNRVACMARIPNMQAVLGRFPLEAPIAASCATFVTNLAIQEQDSELLMVLVPNLRGAVGHHRDNVMLVRICMGAFGALALNKDNRGPLMALLPLVTAMWGRFSGDATLVCRCADMIRALADHEHEDDVPRLAVVVPNLVVAMAHFADNRDVVHTCVKCLCTLAQPGDPDPRLMDAVRAVRDVMDRYLEDGPMMDSCTDFLFDISFHEENRARLMEAVPQLQNVLHRHQANPEIAGQCVGCSAELAKHAPNRAVLMRLLPEAWRVAQLNNFSYGLLGHCADLAKEAVCAGDARAVPLDIQDLVIEELLPRMPLPELQDFAARVQVIRNARFSVLRATWLGVCAVDPASRFPATDDDDASGGGGGGGGSAGAGDGDSSSRRLRRSLRKRKVRDYDKPSE